MPSPDASVASSRQKRKPNSRLIALSISFVMTLALVLFQRQSIKLWWAGKQPYAALSHRVDNGETDPDVLLLFARKSLEVGQSEAALKAAMSATRSISSSDTGPQATKINAEAGYIIACTGDETKAAEYLQRALQVSPTNKQALLGMAILSTRRQDLRAAHARLEELLQIDPTNAEAWMRLGTVCLDEGENQSAVDALERAVALKPNDAATHADLGEAYGRLTRFQDAAKEQQTAIRLNPKETGYQAMLARSLAYAARTDEEYTRANDALSGWLKDNPDDDAIRLTRAGLNMRFTKFEDARRDFETSLSNDPSNVDALYNLSTVLFRLNDPLAEKTEQEFQRLIDKDIAIVSLTKAVERKPDDIKIRISLAGAYRKNGRFNEAFEQVSIAAKMAPANKQVQSMYVAAKAYIDNMKRTSSSQPPASGAANP